VIGVPTDLANLSSVFHAVEQIKSITPTIDIFFANAGVSRGPTPLSKDGLETVFAINYVGHYALITRLLPILIKTSNTPDGDVRIVMTSSSLAWWSRRIDYNALFTPFNELKEKPIEMYTRSKLACLLFGMILAKHVRRRGGNNVRVNTAEPGIIFGTGMHLQMETTYAWWVKWITRVMEWTVGLTKAEGALTMLFLGTSPQIKEGDVNGRFFRPFGDEIQVEKWPKNATQAAAEKLWEWSESFVSTREIEIERVAVTHL
jgi:NAD(P)-dependent dehydrogenase (short-subunit alcohol dehydrogenase family)